MEAYAHLKTAQELREEGNREFKGGYYDAAAAKYRAALKKDNNWALLHCNLALCFAKQEKWEECIQAATACLEAPSCDAATTRKALLHRSRAYRASPHRRSEADFDHARADIERALATDPLNKILKRELAGLLNGEGISDAALPDAPALSLSLKKAELYGTDEADARRDAKPILPPAPPEAWVQQRLADALARRRAERDDAPLKKGYDGHAPAFTRTPSTKADVEATARLARAAPAKIGAVDANQDVEFNRGYKEIDVSAWARHRLAARLHAVQAQLVDGDARDAYGGVVRVTPRSVGGDALAVRVAGRWTRAYDLNCRLDFEARLGAPRTQEVTIKGKRQRVFMGVPTVRGAFVVRELTHDEGPDESICDLEWGHGSSAQHLESDEVGLSKAHADALRNLLYPHDGGAVCEAVRAMLAGFVADFAREVPGEPRPRLRDASEADHRAAVGYDGVPLPEDAPPAPWRFVRPTAVASDQPAGAAPVQKQGREDDARGGFGHGMMEQFEALNKDGYTVLMGAGAAPAPAPSVVDYSRFENLHVSDDDDDEVPAGEAPAPSVVDYSRFENLHVSDDDDDEVPAGEAPAPSVVDYSRFENLHVSDDDEEVDEVPAAEEIPDLTSASDETRDLWNVLLKIAEGDVEEARRLMQNPEEIKSHPMIRCLYASSCA